MGTTLKDKIIVITGGAEGIGYNIADNYTKNEAILIIILDINEDKRIEATNTLNLTYGAGKAIFIKCDVTKDLDEVGTKIINTYKTIDVLINNAGILKEQYIRKTIETNLIAVMEWSKMFWDHMRTDKGGKGGTILNIASVAGFLISPFLICYKTSKSGVVAFTSTLGHEYNFKKSGVRVIALCPGLTTTSIIKEMKSWDIHDEEFQNYLKMASVQSPDYVGEASVEVFQNAPSGTSWTIENGKPAVEAPDVLKLSCDDIMKLKLSSSE